ncbi:MAG TPA: hypothetical protein PKN32_12370 [Bacteroidales bacterium]|nr:hypothetical protein [Bacteroidales bacterium]
MVKITDLSRTISKIAGFYKVYRVVVFLLICGIFSLTSNIVFSQKTFNIPCDSLCLSRYLDSLQKVEMPYVSKFYNRNKEQTIQFSDFPYDLTNAHVQLIPIQIEGGRIDFDDDTLFSVVDSTGVAKWNLLSRRNKFFVVELNSGCARTVTLNYEFEVIDAINTGTADPLGNAYFSFSRKSEINYELEIILEYEYYSRNPDDENDVSHLLFEDHWFIDENGFFKKR